MKKNMGTAWALATFKEINETIKSGVKKLLGDQAKITEIKHYTLKSKVEDEGLREIRVRGTVVCFNPLCEILQEVIFKLVCVITKNEKGIWRRHRPELEVLKPGKLIT